MDSSQTPFPPEDNSELKQAINHITVMFYIAYPDCVKT